MVTIGIQISEHFLASKLCYAAYSIIEARVWVVRSSRESVVL